MLPAAEETVNKYYSSSINANEVLNLVTSIDLNNAVSDFILIPNPLVWLDYYMGS